MASILAGSWALAQPPAGSSRLAAILTAVVTATWAHVGLSVASVGRLLGRSSGAVGGSLLCAAVDGGDAAVEAGGAGVDSGGVDAGKDLTGGVEVACSGVAFGEPGLVEGDFAGVVVVVAGECSGEEGFGGGLAEFDEAAGGHDVDLGPVEPVDPFGFGDAVGALVVGVEGAAGGVGVAGSGGGPGEAFQQQRPYERTGVRGAGDGGAGDEQRVVAFADVGDLVGEAGQQLRAQCPVAGCFGGGDAGQVEALGVGVVAGVAGDPAGELGQFTDHGVQPFTGGVGVGGGAGEVFGLVEFGADDG